MYKLIKEIKTCSLFGLLFDESMDISKKKQLSIYVTYLDKSDLRLKLLFLNF